MATRLCKMCENQICVTEMMKAPSKQNWKNTSRPRQSYHSYCKPCRAEYARQFRAKYTSENGKGYRGSDKIKKVEPKDRKLMSLIRGRLVEANGRAKKFNKITPDIDEDFLLNLFEFQNRKCALTGIDFVIEKKHPLCPSLDKIEPDKGYTKDNVQWLSWAANRAKGDLTTHDFVTMCKRIVEVSERATTIP